MSRWILVSFYLLLSADAQAECRVVLLPGAFEAGSWVGRLLLPEERYFGEYREFFKARGCQVEQLRFPADATIEQRAFLVRNRLQEREPGWVIAHSQAGLDLRFALRSLGLRPASLRGVVSIGAPHRGSKVASWALEHQRRNSWLARILRALGYDLGELRFLPEMEASFLQDKATYFAQEPGVPWYFAAAECSRTCHWGLRLLQKISGSSGGDGLVELPEQAFGESLGVYELDHLSEVATGGSGSAERKRLLDRIWGLISGG